MIGGSCLCGEVRWSVDDGAFTRMSHCHCSMCRKAHGAPFATYVNAPPGGFHWLQGEEHIRRFESSPGFTRAFCSRCGSVVPSLVNDYMCIPAGCLDGDPGVRPSAHIFAASKAPWHLMADDLPRHETYPSAQSGPVIDRPPPPSGRAGVLRGSCLCGNVS